METRNDQFLINSIFNVVTILIVIMYLLGLGSVNSKVLASGVREQEVLELANMERSSEGLEPLQMNKNLTLAAYIKAYDMLSKQYWSHYGPSGESAWKFILSSGYQYSVAGENLAYGYENTFDLHNAWMKSNSHRKNILNENFRDVGVAVVEGFFEGKETVLVVEIFGRKRVDEINDEAVVWEGDSDLQILYPEENQKITEKLFGVLGMLRNVEDPNILLEVDEEDESQAIISGNTFSRRLDLTSKGLHQIKTTLEDAGKSVETKIVNFEIIEQTDLTQVEDLLWTEKSNKFILTGRLEGVDELVLKQDLGTYDCSIEENDSVSEGNFSCSLPKEDFSKPNKELILVDSNLKSRYVNVDQVKVEQLQEANILGGFSQVGSKLAFIDSVASKLSLKLLTVSFLSIVLLIELVRFWVLRERLNFKMQSGYTLSLLVIFIFVEIFSYNGQII
jgi:hypothetical protein